jgi:S-adenosylmethionine decarboxylase
MQTRRLKLQGFNNLTKTLSFNIYDVNYALSERHQREYIEYIDRTYDAERLTQILTEVANIIGANVLNVARQDYDPQGASVTILVSEEPVASAELAAHGAAEAEPGPLPQPAPDAVVAHLDKSHITVHTYPESHPDNGISTFRADIDVSTCGRISPLRALNFLIHSFDSDVVILDYRVRGFTRNVKGMKHFIDHDISSIQDFLSEDSRQRFDMVDVNVYQENIFHTKMMQKRFDLDS